MISATGKKEKQFTAKISIKEAWRYDPGMGINKVIYKNQDFEKTIEHKFKKTQSRIKTQNAGFGELNMMLTASAVNPDPLMRKYKEDIEREMTRLNIVQDTLNPKQEPRYLKGGLEHQQHTGFVSDPAMEELDGIKKNMSNVHHVKVDQAHFNRIQSHMDRYLALYQRPNNMQADAKRFMTELPDRDPHSHRKQYRATVGTW